MKRANFIAVKEFCTSWNIEMEIVQALNENGLIEIFAVRGIDSIDISQLEKLERLVRFYYELDINMEGIETIVHLLQRMNEMQEQITNLRNQLSLYETNM